MLSLSFRRYIQTAGCTPKLSTSMKLFSMHQFLNLYFQASKILLVVSPNYRQYADAYAPGAPQNISNSRQKLVRFCHDKVKYQFFNQSNKTKCQPVQLTNLGAHREHIPSFLLSLDGFVFPDDDTKMSNAGLVRVLKKEQRDAREKNRRN